MIGVSEGEQLLRSMWVKVLCVGNCFGVLSFSSGVLFNELGYYFTS